MPGFVVHVLVDDETLLEFGYGISFEDLLKIRL